VLGSEPSERRAGSSFVRGSAAEQKSTAKRSLALSCLDGNQLASVVPFSPKTTGLCSESADDFLKAMDGAPAEFRNLR
jgi:hypothetical protein